MHSDMCPFSLGFDDDLRKFSFAAKKSFSSIPYPADDVKLVFRNASSSEIDDEADLNSEAIDRSKFLKAVQDWYIVKKRISKARKKGGMCGCF